MPDPTASAGAPAVPMLPHLKSSQAAIDLIVCEEVSSERLKELLSYDPVTGEFRWRVSRRGHAGKARKGAVAGSIEPNGYVQIGIDGKTYRAHRLAVLYMTGEWPVLEPDHRNRNRSDNSWDNLRPATRSQNAMNATLPTDNKSGIKGVRYRADKGKWLAFIGSGHRHIHLGYFETKDEATSARQAASVKYHGEFSCHG